MRPFARPVYQLRQPRATFRDRFRGKLQPLQDDRSLPSEGAAQQRDSVWTTSEFVHHHMIMNQQVLGRPAFDHPGLIWRQDAPLDQSIDPHRIEGWKIPSQSPDASPYPPQVRNPAEMK
jgi:hypothetical protein